MSFVVGPFQSGDDGETRNFGEGSPPDRLVMVSDSDEIQPMFTGMASEVIEWEQTVGSERVGVQVAFQPAANFWSET